MENIIELTDETVFDFVKKPFSIILVYSDKCKYCKDYVPFFENVTTHYPDIQFGKLSAFQCPKFSEAIGLEAIPFLSIWREGQDCGGGVTTNLEAVLALITHLKQLNSWELVK